MKDLWSIKGLSKATDWRNLMVQCGFSDVSVHSLARGIATIYRGKKQ